MCIMGGCLVRFGPKRKPISSDLNNADNWSGSIVEWSAFWPTLKYLYSGWSAVSVLTQSGELKSQGANVKQEQQTLRRFISNLIKQTTIRAIQRGPVTEKCIWRENKILSTELRIPFHVLFVGVGLCSTEIKGPGSGRSRRDVKERPFYTRICFLSPPEHESVYMLYNINRWPQIYNCKVLRFALVIRWIELRTVCYLRIRS